MTISDNNRLIRRVEDQRIDDELLLPIHPSQLSKRVKTLADQLTQFPDKDGITATPALPLSTEQGMYSVVLGYSTLEGKPWLKISAEDGVSLFQPLDFAGDMLLEDARAAGEIILEIESQQQEAIASADARARRVGNKSAYARSHRRHASQFPATELRYK